MTFPRGLYDLVLTEAVARSLENLAPDVPALRDLDTEEVTERLIDVLGRELRGILDHLDGGHEEEARAQLELVNGLLAQLRADRRSSEELVELVETPPRILQSIRGPGESAPIAPETGLAAPWLFTAGRGSPSLLTEIRREAAACDQIDILVSFITVSGVRKLIDVLRSVTAANAAGEGRTRIRVLTTTYTGATEIEALDELARLNGCEIKVSLDGRRTRLHAKAWIFHRRSGFGSAYVGSANLSGAALMGGLEWTMKFTERGQEALFGRAKAHFDTLWLDDEFARYAPEDPENRAAVVEALRREAGERIDGPLPFFDIQPKPYQRDMLDQLAREREHGRNRNLLVAATGTGKTVVAALDYRDTCAKLGHRPRLLFVAHRAQILRQALRTYREVLRDHSFGEQLTGGMTPARHDYLFASIDSLTSGNLVDRLGSDYWHTVVIDECHRLAADRFDRLARAIRPAQLLGLTATPERSDGQPIQPYFTPRPDGEPAVELRLWDALDMQLLAPFEYYACDDETDFSDVPWDRPGEVAAIERLVTGNDVRARMVINEWQRLSGNPRRSKALVFCVSVAHARFMADKLTASGLPALCVVGETPKIEQLRAPRRLTNGEVCAIVTVDLYNEGVDLPDVDTLILLRPTQSPVLFQQQIGRGLRLSPGKESCLVLDFVGQHRADFRFDRLLAGITGLTRTQLIDAVEHGFSTLPPGCHIQLQRQTRQQVLRSLRTLVQQSWRRLTAEVLSYSTVKGTRNIRLGDFLHDQRIALEEIYRDSRPSGWTTLKRSAGLLPGEQSDAEATLSRRLGDLLHVDDPAQLALMRRVAEARAEYVAETSDDRLRAQMLAYQVDSGREPLSYQSMLARLAEYPACAEELGELADVLAARSRVERRPVPKMEDVPLQLHGAYRIREILTAVGYLTAERRTPFQAGVLGLQDRRTELLFVTLDKSAGFHDRIAYHDYAVSPKRFHWQTQNSAGPHTQAGRRYLESLTNGWTFQLFVRVHTSDPYRACGPVRIVTVEDITGDRPMNITWTLDVPLPPKLFAEFSVLRGQT
jgi:superfamily II DNA or RNA helicase/HKD family nuclease